jgi:hypothetical protein
MEISVKSLLLIILTTAVLSGVSVFLISHQKQIKELKEKLPEIPKFPSFSDLFRRDPFNGKKDTHAWPSNGTGLQLTILNALEEEWNTYFFTALEQWDAGSPDTLTLKTESRPAPDFNCTAEQGYMKVCNGDYGATEWTGVNQLVLAGKGKDASIISSTARMNEFYLMPSEYNVNQEAARQYTMCHEIGHGFGLPHFDEDFYNNDDGNCLDITINPEANMQPDQENFNLLKKLYGKVERNSDGVAESALLVGDVQTNSTDLNHGSRLRRRDYEDIQSDYAKVTSGTFPNWITDALTEINENFILTSISDRRHRQTMESLTIGNKYSRRLIRQSQYTQHHEFDIGSGYSIQVHFLLSH